MFWFEVLDKLKNRPLKLTGLLAHEKRKLQKALTEFAIKHQEILGIILFGSRARGDWEGFSDWDVLFVVDEADERFATLVYSFCDDLSEKLSFGTIQPLIEEALKRAEPILARNILKDGKVIYAVSTVKPRA